MGTLAICACSNAMSLSEKIQGKYKLSYQGLCGTMSLIETLKCITEECSGLT